MSIATKLIWPILIVLGVLSVLVFDAGSGLDSSAFWLIPLGAIGGTMNVLSKRGLSKSLLLFVVWGLAFISIAGLYFEWFFDNFEVFFWAFPALAFTSVGTVMLVAYLFEFRRSTNLTLLMISVCSLLWIYFRGTHYKTVCTTDLVHNVCQTNVPRTGWVTYVAPTSLVLLFITLLVYFGHRAYQVQKLKHKEQQ